MASFKDRVIRFIKTVPKGKIVSYGQVAAICGHPRAARQVGMILKNLPVWPAGRDMGKYSKVPWWRVVNKAGMLSIKGNWSATKEMQRDLLLREGIEIDQHFKMALNKYKWQIR